MKDEEREAFLGLVAAHGSRFVRLATLLGGREGADDMVQLMYERLLPRWPALHRDGNPTAYARQVLVNLHVDEGRRRTRRPEVLRDVPETEVGAEADQVLERLAVLAALASLPPAQRAVVTLRLYEDLSERDTAALLGISQGTVKSHLARGTTALRTLLGDRSQACTTT